MIWWFSMFWFWKNEYCYWGLRKMHKYRMYYYLHTLPTSNQNVSGFGSAMKKVWPPAQCHRQLCGPLQCLPLSLPLRENAILLNHCFTQVWWSDPTLVYCFTNKRGKSAVLFLCSIRLWSLSLLLWLCRSKTIHEVINYYPVLKSKNIFGIESTEYTNRHWVMLNEIALELHYPNKNARR